MKRQLADEYGICESGPIAEQVDRVARRLQAKTPLDERLVAVVLENHEVPAFTAPGRYVYVTRRFLERVACDLWAADAIVAMTLAHEIAHHELGHLRLHRVFLPRLVTKRLGHRSQTQELEADCRAIEICIEATYDPQKCLRLYGLCAFLSLDNKDTPTVFGGENFDPNSTHPPLTKRERVVRGHLAAILAREQSRAGPYRDHFLRSHCGQCDRDVRTVCACCEKPLCNVHSSARHSTCVNCSYASGPLCTVCRRSVHCRRCGVSSVCRYCRSAASRTCPRCLRSFCRSHGPKKSKTCRGCRDEPAVEDPKRLSFIVTVILLIAVLLVTPIVL